MDRWTERFNSDGEKAIVIHDGSDFPDVYFEGEKEYDAMNAFADYEDLEEQGLLIKLPCKIGDTVFIIVGKDISKQTIREMEISDDGIIKFKTKRRTFSATWFGIDVFTTYKEAEMELRNRWKD